jgi:hypothetical protein
VGVDVPVGSEPLFVTNFVNLKIKFDQFFGGAHTGRVRVRVFIRVSIHMCMTICVCTVFLKNTLLSSQPKATGIRLVPSGSGLYLNFDHVISVFSLAFEHQRFNSSIHHLVHSYISISHVSPLYLS